MAHFVTLDLAQNNFVPRNDSCGALIQNGFNTGQ
jgi:hypothetical protein